MKRFVLGICFLAYSLVSKGGEGLLELPDQSVYAKDGLFLKVALVDDPKEFLEEWSKPPQLREPGLKTRTAFHRGEIVFPAIMYSTTALTPDGKANITCDLLFRRPDGSVYERMENLPVVDGKPPKDVALGKSKAGLKIEDTDPPGRYTLKVTLTDHVRNETVEMLFEFTVVGGGDGSSTATDEPAPVNPDLLHRDETAPSPTPYPSWNGRVRSASGDPL